MRAFAVGPDWVQVDWRSLGPGRITFDPGTAPTVALDADGGPGAAVIGGLGSDAEITIEVQGAGVAAGTRITARTLARPPGERLVRLATVSDCHIGSTGTGYLHTIVEKPRPAVPHPERCLAAAVTEAGAWGAEHLVAKGDLVERSDPDTWDAAARALGERTPAILLPGNHERSRWGDGRPAAGAATVGTPLTESVTALDLPGLRVVGVDTAVPGEDRGTVAAHLDAIVDAVADAARGGAGALVCLHHQPTRFPFPTYLPVGIPGPESRPLLDGLAAANPRTWVTAGHTHRHRARRHGPIVVTEVGATKDYPGTWAGYDVHEGGIVQVVRRIAEPDCIRWTEHTARAALGVWRHWAPGRLGDRCLSLGW